MERPAWGTSAAAAAGMRTEQLGVAIRRCLQEEAERQASGVEEWHDRTLESGRVP